MEERKGAVEGDAEKRRGRIKRKQDRTERKRRNKTSLTRVNRKKKQEDLETLRLRSQLADQKLTTSRAFWTAFVAEEKLE